MALPPHMQAILDAEASPTAPSAPAKPPSPTTVAEGSGPADIAAQTRETVLDAQGVRASSLGREMPVALREHLGADPVLPMTEIPRGPLAGQLADAYGCRRMCVTGMGLVAVSGGLLLLWQPATPPWQIVGTLIVLGLGMGFTQSPVAAAVTFTVAGGELGVALGIFNMVRFIGASLGSTVFGVILDGAIAGGEQSAYRMCFGLLMAVALAAVLLALGVPTTRRSVQSLANKA